MPNSYEHSFQHNLDDVLDASDAVLAIGTEKVDTTTLKDRSLNNNNGTIHGAMPSNEYFLGRQFDGDDDFLNFNGIEIDKNNGYICCVYNLKANPSSNYTGANLLSNISKYNAYIQLIKNIYYLYIESNGSEDFWCHYETSTSINIINIVECFADNGTVTTYLNGVLIDTTTPLANLTVSKIGGTTESFSNADIIFTMVSTLKNNGVFNTIARLPLYSHNFERYPNSDTSLTSVFPYTSGIITSGSFNKTDGLKCTSAGQIIFSNSFEFDGSEYITLVIGGVEYSGTTTVTQGTVTATIAQGSNDITIDMGTNDVLEDIQIQFREEV